MIQKQPLLVAGVVTVLAVIGVLILTLLLTPASNPAYDVAVDFVNAAAKGDDAVAVVLLDETMQAYVTQNCPEGKPSTCITGYTPPAWGAMLSAIYRRSIPAGDDAWDVLLVATYAEGQGFSGVCIYNRVEREPGTETWRVAGWSGFVSCDEPGAGLSELRDRPDSPNRAP